MKPALQILHKGIQPYPLIWEEMLAFTLSRTSETLDEIWVLQHEPVFTQGQAGKPEHILDAHAIPVVQTDRGGQVTYHGPGQIIIYLLLDVKRNKLGVRDLVDAIENSMISVLAEYGIQGLARKDAPGVYVNKRKIGALGLRIKKGCSYHGLSFNVDMDMEPFSYINPCGYQGLEVTQLRDLVGESQADLINEVQQKLIGALSRHLL